MLSPLKEINNMVDRRRTRTPLKVEASLEDMGKALGTFVEESNVVIIYYPHLWKFVNDEEVDFVDEIGWLIAHETIHSPSIDIRHTNSWLTTGWP